MSRPATLADALRLPAVSDAQRERVLLAAGPAVLPALAVLASAIAWHLARNVTPGATKAVRLGMATAILRAAGLGARE